MLEWSIGAVSKTVVRGFESHYAHVRELAKMVNVPSQIH